MIHNAEQFGEHIRAGIQTITEFISSEPFVRVMQEFRKVPRELRDHFIRSVLINRSELAKRGVQVPEDLTVQRSEFEDGRPTLFCVVKHLPDHKRKVTITFDDGWDAHYFEAVGAGA